MKKIQGFLVKFVLTLPGAVDEFPFGPEVRVFKVTGKMFALMSTDETPARITLKCQPDDAVQLCDLYSSITPGYHMNKKHWITVLLNGEVPEQVLTDLIDKSYLLVVQKLPKKERDRLKIVSLTRS